MPIQRELNEVRLGSASGSNVSGEGRTEAVDRVDHQGLGVKLVRRVKAKELRPPATWTSFAGMQPDSHTPAYSGQLAPWTGPRCPAVRAGSVT